MKINKRIVHRLADVLRFLVTSIFLMSAVMSLIAWAQTGESMMVLPAILSAWLAAIIWRWMGRPSAPCANFQEQEKVAEKPREIITTGADNEWGDLQRASLSQAAEMQWGLYRNSQLQMAEFLLRERRYKQGLRHLLIVLFLDVNGPMNCGKINGVVDARLFKDLSPFDPADGDVLPYVAELVVDVTEELGLDDESLKSEFIKAANSVKNKLMPVSPMDAWALIQSKAP